MYEGYVQSEIFEVLGPFRNDIFLAFLKEIDIGLIIFVGITDKYVTTLDMTVGTIGANIRIKTLV